MASENKKGQKKSRKNPNRKANIKAEKKSKEVNAVNQNIININLPEKKKSLVVRWIEKLLKVAGLLPIIFDWWRF
jgi:DNA-binding transcriptional regulator WhiA